MGDTLCRRCGAPAAGYAAIDGQRYCHGDNEQPTCYMRQSWDESFKRVLADVGSDRLVRRDDLLA
jgi:hypothetical protein